MSANVYYNPEDFGLEVVGEVEWEEPCYSFNKTVVWYHPESRTFYWASDSGCSCPTPFESCYGLETLESGNAHEAFMMLSHRRAEEESWRNEDCYGAAQMVELVSKVRSYSPVIQEI